MKYVDAILIIDISSNCCKFQYLLNYRFKATFILSQPPMNWNNCSGHISKDHIAANISLPDDSIDTLICICGPTIFTESANRLSNVLYIDYIFYISINVLFIICL